MADHTLTRTSHQVGGLFSKVTEIPGILVAYVPQGSTPTDRCGVTANFCVGRDPSSDFPIKESNISKRHFQINKKEKVYFITDLSSTNGTFVNGKRLTPGQQEPLQSNSVIRAGEAVLVFHEDAKTFLDSSSTDQFNMSGRFYTQPLLKALEQAAISGRHVLLAGPSGTGKELSARALTMMMGEDDNPLMLVTHNAARFSSEEEAASTLFGVGAKVFSDVDARPGLIEQADSGVLFLDEIHNLPGRVQRSLLRVIEDGLVCRIGESEQRRANVQFIFASNAPAPDYELAHDILARLRVVTIPPLSERRADIPTIFNAVLKKQLSQHNIPTRIIRNIKADHYESLCLDSFPSDNVRGLVDLADRLATRIVTGIDAPEAIVETFSERYGETEMATRYSDIPPPAKKNSHYEQNKDIIIDAYRECGGNVSRTVDLLQSRGIRCTKRWLAVYADEWGLREKKK